MRLLTRAASVVSLLLALSASVMAAPVAEGLPDIDPLDPVTCDHEQGYVVVAIAWTNAWYDAYKAGKLEEPRATDLAVWYTQMQNYLIESDDVKGSCLALIEVRKAHEF